MNHREKIREHAARALLKLAEPLKGNSFTTKELADQAVDVVSGEFLAALEAVLGAEPSEEMLDAAANRVFKQSRTLYAKKYRAMAAQLLREMK